MVLIKPDGEGQKKRAWMNVKSQLIDNGYIEEVWQRHMSTLTALFLLWLMKCFSLSATPGQQWPQFQAIVDGKSLKCIRLLDKYENAGGITNDDADPLDEPEKGI